MNARPLSVGSGKAHWFPIEELYIALKSRMGVRDADESETKISCRQKKSGAHATRLTKIRKVSRVA